MMKIDAFTHSMRGPDSPTCIQSDIFKPDTGRVHLPSQIFLR